MTVYLLGLRVTESAQENDDVLNVLADCLPASDKRVNTKVQLLQNKSHYVGKLLGGLKKDDTVLALGPTRATPDGTLQMQPMLVVSKENFNDLLAVNLFVAAGGLGPKAEEVEITDTTVTNRSLAWQTEEKEPAWFKLTAWAALSTQLADLAPGTPTIAVGKVSTTEKAEKNYLNYTVDKILYLPKTSKAAPKKAAALEKGKVAAAALASIDISL